MLGLKETQDIVIAKKNKTKNLTILSPKER